MTKQQVEQQYLEVKSKIKVELTTIKTYAEAIQQSKNKIDELGKQMEQLQQQYLQLEEVKNENK